MSAGPHLVVETHEGRYGLPADRVQQVLWLPVLSVSDRGGAWIGTAHLDEDAVEVADLDRVFGREPAPYSLDHRLVNVETTEGRMGLVVADVADVVPIEGTEPVDGPGPVIGQAVVEGKPVAIVDVDAVPQAADAAEPSAEAERLFASFSKEQVEELARRQRRLTSHAPVERERGREAVIAEAGGGLLALRLSEVRAFVHVDDAVPLPATPDRVVGLVNHEGEVAVVVDVSAVLGFPESLEGPPFVVAMVEHAEGLTGVAVERIGDTVDLSGARDDGEAPGVVGTLEHEERSVPVVDLGGLLRSDAFVVDQEA